jgi:hypothetical protein
MTKHTKLMKLYIKYRGNKRQRKQQGGSTLDNKEAQARRV